MAVANCSVSRTVNVHRAEPDDPRRAREDRLIERATKVLENRLRYQRVELSSPERVRKFLRFRMEGLEHEEFWAVWLNAKNEVIATDCMSVGTLTQTSVYPREIVKQALGHNAAAVIVAHNHPSGGMEPSGADHALTRSLKEALSVVDVKLLDHFIVGGEVIPLSFAEHGWI